jgi:hypothetical protein
MLADRDAPLSWERISIIDVNGGSLFSGDKVFLRTNNPLYYGGISPSGVGDTMRADYDSIRPGFHHLQDKRGRSHLKRTDKLR